MKGWLLRSKIRNKIQFKRKWKADCSLSNAQVSSPWTAMTATFSSPAVRSSFIIIALFQSSISNMICCCPRNWRPRLETIKFCFEANFNHFSSFEANLNQNFQLQLVTTRGRCCWWATLNMTKRWRHIPLEKKLSSDKDFCHLTSHSLKRIYF